jgi:hypothetical protein
MDNHLEGKAFVQLNFVYYKFHFTQWIEAKLPIPHTLTYGHETIIIIQATWCYIPNKT